MINLFARIFKKFFVTNQLDKKNEKPKKGMT